MQNLQNENISLDMKINKFKKKWTIDKISYFLFIEFLLKKIYVYSLLFFLIINQ